MPRGALIVFDRDVTAPGGFDTAFSHGVMKYTKNVKLAKDFLKWFHGKETFGRWFQVAEGFSIGATKFWEQHPLWSTIDEPMKGFRTYSLVS